MLNREQVIETLSGIIDPLYNHSITNLNLVRDILAKENKVSLTLVTTSEDGQYQANLKDQVTQLLKQAGVEEVHLRLRPISEFEASQLPSLKENDNVPRETSNAVEVLNPLAPESKTQFIAIASGKGGVGKSTVTVNLAVALARKGKKVGIIDADIYGFSVPDMMGIEERPQLVDNLIVPVERHGVKVMSMGFFVEDNAPIIWRGPMLGKMLKNFFNEVNWGELDYLLLDLPPGTGDIALDVHGMIPQSKEIIVTTPHATAAFVAARAGAMAIKTEHEILGVVENMAYYECNKCGDKQYLFGRGGGGKLAEELHTELLAQIPLGAPDNNISEPDYSPSVYKANTQTGRMYLEVAEQVIQKLG